MSSNAAAKETDGPSAPQRARLAHIRNIGIAAHIDAGKTTLTERILYYTGASHKIGEVHDAAAHMDFMPEERAHGITIMSAVTQCPWKDHLIQIVDTPGHVDFTIEVDRAMRVLDGAVIVLDGVRGVEPQTETVWRQASHFEVPRLIFVNKMDRPGASFERAMATVEKRLGGHPVPVCVPTDDGNAVIHLVEERRYTFHGDLGEEVHIEPVPEHLRDLLQTHRETLLLAAAEIDADLEDAVLEERPVPAQALWSALRKGTLAGRLHPVFGGTALRNKGVQPLLDGIVRLLPSPLDRPPTLAHQPDGDPELVEMDPDGPLAALAFKVQLWDGRRHVFARLYRGRLAPGDRVRLAGREVVERVARIFEVDASKKMRTDRAEAGQIILIAGLRQATTGDTLCALDHEVLLERIKAKEPVLGLAIEPESSRDEDKLIEVLAKLCEEDPTLRFEEDPDTGQRILKGMGELHLQIVFERVEREFGLKVRAGKPRVMTRETIARAGRADSRLDRRIVAGDNEIHLKARAVAEVRPLAREAGIETEVSPIVRPAGASLSPAQLDAVRAGVEDGLQAGPVEGAPLQDLAVRLTEVELYDDASSPQALRIVAHQAVREALRNAGGLVLRPLMRIEVIVPDENVGTVLGDLQARGATITGQETELGTSTIHGDCPLEALLGYATELRSLTRGRGQFTMEFARFDVA